MEMPFHLKTLPPEALDILRFFGGYSEDIARADAIMEGAGLNERRFGVALRRLVTKSYLVMDGYQTYRLSENGRRAANDLVEYETAFPQTGQNNKVRLVTRRMVMVVPRILLAGQPTNVFIGFDEPADEDVLEEPINLLLRLQVVNGDPSMNNNKDSAVMIENKTVRQVFEIAAGSFSKIRLRCFVYQVENEEDVPEAVGGMYIDLNVAANIEHVDRTLMAYGVDVFFNVRG